MITISNNSDSVYLVHENSPRMDTGSYGRVAPTGEVKNFFKEFGCVTNTQRRKWDITYSK
jgi:hypothetical protein